MNIFSNYFFEGGFGLERETLRIDKNGRLPPVFLFYDAVAVGIGSSNDRAVALEKDIQFILASFPMSERLIFNRTYAGYRGSLTFTEDLYDNL